MPLDEDEQRILHEIEQRFYASDPDSAQRIRSTTLHRYLARNIRWAIAGFVAGLIVLLVSFESSWVVGIFGFLVMVASAVVLIQNVRKVGRLGLHQLHETFGARNLGEAMGEFGRRLRERFGTDDD